MLPKDPTSELLEILRPKIVLLSSIKIVDVSLGGFFFFMFGLSEFMKIIIYHKNKMEKLIMLASTGVEYT